MIHIFQKVLGLHTDNVRQPVSSKLNVKEDVAIKNANVKEIMPKKLRNNFFLKLF